MRRAYLALAPLLTATILLAPTAKADTSQDQGFYRLLVDPDQDHPMVIWDFPLIRAQGIEACQREDAGETPMQTTYHLDQKYGGPYTFEDASNITAAADTIYCPWHQTRLSSPDWARTPDPVYPAPVYPPIAWTPGQLHPAI